MSGLIIEEMQEIADEIGFDLRKLPYGFQFRIGKLVLNYYHTTKTVVTSQPKSDQKVKKDVSIPKLKTMLKKLKGKVKADNLILGEVAISVVLGGGNVKHKRVGESEWRRDDIRKLPLNSFLNKTFIFELGE